MTILLCFRLGIIKELLPFFSSNLLYVVCRPSWNCVVQNSHLHVVGGMPLSTCVCFTVTCCSELCIREDGQGIHRQSFFYICSDVCLDLVFFRHPGIFIFFSGENDNLSVISLCGSREFISEKF